MKREEQNLLSSLGYGDKNYQYISRVKIDELENLSEKQREILSNIRARIEALES